MRVAPQYILLALLIVLLTCGCTQNTVEVPHSLENPTSTTAVTSSDHEISVSEDLSKDNLIVETYNAKLFWNGTFIETYTYNVKEPGVYRMLFRVLGVPLSFESLNQPYIEHVSVSGTEDTIGYAKNFKGDVRTTVAIPSTVHNAISSLALKNEVGMYKMENFNQGTYSVQYRFIIHPPLEYDDSNAHFNFMLLDEHVPIKNLMIEVPSEPVVKVYCTPDTLHVAKNGNSLYITGTGLKDDRINLEFLLQKEILQQMDGFPQFVPNVEGRMDSAYKL